MARGEGKGTAVFAVFQRLKVKRIQAVASRSLRSGGRGKYTNNQNVCVQVLGSMANI